MNIRFRNLVKRALKKLGYEIKQYSPVPNPIHLWDEDDNFNDLYKKACGYTMLNKLSCFIIYQFINQVKELHGDAAEVGVYKGGTAKLLAKGFESKSKNIQLFDTFTGMPPTDPKKDVFLEGAFGDTSLKDVEKYLSDCDNVYLYKGIFPDTAKSIHDKTFCLVHIDVDVYKSVLDSCEFFYPRMAKGGIMIFDDYG